MTDHPKPPPAPNAPVVIAEIAQPCGCLLTKFSNNTQSVVPCPPCGFRDAGNALVNAGKILIATAGTLARLNNAPPPMTIVRGGGG